MGPHSPAARKAGDDAAGDREAGVGGFGARDMNEGTVGDGGEYVQAAAQMACINRRPAKNITAQVTP